MKKKTKTILLIILCAVVITVAYIAAFGDYSTINSQLGEYYGMLKNSDSKDIVASYKDKNITLKVLEYQRGLNEMKIQSYQSVNTDSLPDYMKYKSESDRDIINRLIIGMILVEEAEKMGLVPTEEETAEWVAVQKRGYEEVTEMAQIIDEYCMGAGITVEEYWADIEEQAYETCTHLRMRNHFKVRYLKEHGIDENELGGENMQNYLAAYEEYRSGLLEAHKDDIVYYID